MPMSPRLPIRLALLLLLLPLLFSPPRANAALGTTVATFPVPVSHWAADPYRPRIYGSVTGSNGIAVFDSSTMTLIAVIPIGISPLGLAESADGSKLYVANSGSTTDGVGIIDLSALQPLPTLPTPELPSDIAVGLSDRLYLTPGNNSVNEGIMQIDGDTGIFQQQLSNITDNNGFLTVSPDRKTLYYGDTGVDPSSLASFDISTATSGGILQSNDIYAGQNSEDLEISHSGAFISFVNRNSGGPSSGIGIAEWQTNALNTANGYFTSGFSNSHTPGNIAFSPDDAFAYSAPRKDKKLLVFNAKTYSETASFTIPGNVGRLITDSSGHYLFTATLSGNSTNPLAVDVYDTGRAAAVITSPLAETVEQGSPFSYQIAATNTPTSYSAFGLPGGLKVSTAGRISGTPTAEGVSHVVISASNAIGVAMAYLTITVNGAKPFAALTVGVNGDGSVTSGLLGTTYPIVGSSISVSANAAPGYIFTGWSGGITSTANPLDLTVNSPTSIQANFTSAGFGELMASFNIPAHRFALDPIRPRIYASITGSDSIAVIDTNTLGLIQVIPVGSQPLGLAVTPDGSRLYVANSQSALAAISVIDLATLTTLPSLPAPSFPSDVAVGLNNNLYVAAENANDENEIMQITTGGAYVTSFGDTGVAAGGYMAISPDKKTLYFGSTLGLENFDVSSGTTGTNIQVSSLIGGGYDLELSHSGTFLSFAEGQSTIAELQAANLNTAIGYFTTGLYGETIAFSPDDSFAYSAPQYQKEVRAFDTKTFNQSGSFSIPGGASRLTTDSSGKYLFVAALDPSVTNYVGINVYGTGRPAAVITSATSAFTEAREAFSYQIIATNNPTYYNASGLPAGLSINTATGLISGTCAGAGVTQAFISARNAVGTAMAYLSIKVGPGVTAPLTVTTTGNGAVTNTTSGASVVGTTDPYIGIPISITAKPAAGYVFSGWSGDITSTVNPLVFTMTGRTSIEANFVTAPPSVTSASRAGAYGKAFSYQIQAVGKGSITYGATGLPAGLSVDSGTGLISGTFMDAGHFSVTLTGSNAGGAGTGSLALDVDALLMVSAGANGSATPTGTYYVQPGSTVTLVATPAAQYAFSGWTGTFASSSDPLTFTMQPDVQLQANFAVAPPSVSSAARKNIFGGAFSYQIKATGIGPITYGAAGLPAGLTVNPATGLITGVFNDAGTFNVVLTGSNGGGTGYGALALSVDARLIVSSGANGTVSPKGTFYLPESSTVILTATPKKGHIFGAWTGTFTSGSDPLVFAMQPSVTLEGSFAEPNAGQGDYAGLVLAPVPAANDSGYLSLFVNRIAQFAGYMEVAGVRYPFSGDFSKFDSTTFKIRRRALPSLTGTVALDLSGTTPRVIGEVTNGTWTSAISSERSAVYTPGHVCPVAQNYTLALLATQQGQTIPVGSCYGTMFLDDAGLGRYAGILADGTPYAGSAPVAPDDTLPVYIPRYGDKGVVIGTLVFPSNAHTGIAQGTLAWVKPATAANKPYPAPFSTSLNAVGSTYTSHLRITGTGGSLVFAGGNLGAPFTQDFKLNAAHTVVITQPNPNAVTFSLNLNTGVFSGTFLDPIKRQAFHGVIFQQQNAGAGDFLDATTSGSVTLNLSP